MAKASLHSGAAPAAPAAGAVAKPTGSFVMPAIFSGTPNPIQARAWAPYVTFAHPARKDEWNKITALNKNVESGDMYFIHNDRIVQLDVAKLGLIAATQYWVSKNAAGVVQAVSMTERPDPFDEHILAAVLVYLDDGIVPANVEFRTTKCPMGKALSDALIEAATPEWGAKSAAHKETLVLNQPFLRFYGECSIAAARPGKSSGMPYRPGQCEIKPVALPELRLIKELSDDFDASGPKSKLMEMVAQRYQSKLDELKPKMVQ